MAIKTLEVPIVAGTAGAAVDILYLEAEKSVQVTDISTGTLSYATLQLEGSNDNVFWTQIGEDITTDGIYVIDCMMAFLRVRTAAWTAGIPAVTLTGYGPGGT